MRDEATAQPVVECADLGRRPYLPVLQLQRHLADDVAAGGVERLLLVEHAPPVITLGRRGDAGQVLAGAEELASAGVEVHRVERGGGATYHGPGQLTAYPILRVRPGRRNLRYIQRGLEEVVIRLLAGCGIVAERLDGLTGVWVGGRKIAAVGIAARRWVAYHGLALNVSIDPARFRLIVPCGIADRGVTSMFAEGARLPMEEVKRRFVGLFAKVFEVSIASAGRRGLFSPRAASGQAIVPRGSGGLRRKDHTAASRPRLPAWLRRKVPASGLAPGVRRLLDELNLHTVCTGARCPNRAECFARGTATFMILGRVCTRSCRFCAVPTGPPGLLRDDEPDAVAQAAAALGLRHVVITSVTRDDLPDGGAGHFARTVLAVRRRLPAAGIEVLAPDFLGRRDAIETVLDAGPNVFNHNLETVARLSPLLRPQASYARSLGVLALAAEGAARLGRPRHVKSGLMLGLGETDAEILAALGDLRRAGCDLLTLGQYLAPSPGHAPVERFVPPEEFEHWRTVAAGLGFAAVAAGPVVRSSYRAETLCDRPTPSEANSTVSPGGAAGPGNRRHKASPEPNTRGRAARE